MLRAAIYARYSSENQRETSIEDQVARCRDAAARFGCSVLEDHIYTDQEISGTIGQRPAYTQLLASAKAHEFDAITVESQDRLWRDQAEMHAALKRLRFWGIKVFSVATGTDLTDKTGGLMASVMGWKDEAFLADLRDKTRRGMLGQIKRGFAVGGRAFGYRSEARFNEEHQVVGSQRVVDANEAKVVRRIFEMYAGGMSPKTIARRLNAEHVAPPRASRGRRPLGWAPTTIAGSSKKALGVLNNPVYVGRIIWNRTEKVRNPDTDKETTRRRPQSEWVYAEAPQLRIIPDDLWNAVQRRREEQRKLARGNVTGRKPKYLFSGLLVCEECGQHYVIRSSNAGGGAYYGCATNTNQGKEICPNDQLVRRDRLEETLLRRVFDEVFSPETVAYVSRKVNEALARRTNPPGVVRKRLEAELAKTRTQLENIKAAILEGIRTPSTREMLETAERRVTELESALKTPASKRSNVTALPTVVERYLTDLRGSLGRNPEHARELLAKLLGPITLRRDGGKLVAEMRGNLPALLEMDERCITMERGTGIEPA